MDDRPTIEDVLVARRVISRYLSKTPLTHYPSLSRMLEAQVYLKHENHQPIGAFKVRGGINLISQLTAEEKARGVISASTGNHGQSVAYASGLFGVRSIIVVPEGANPGKVESMRNLGAEVVFHGADFDEAREQVETLTAEYNYRYIHSANEPLLIAGVGTCTLEVLEELPDVEVVLVPVGGGSGACGAAIVAKTINPAIQMIGVGAEKAPAAYLSWKQRKHVEAGMETFAEGMATRVPFELTQSIMRDLLDDFLLVGEEEMKAAILMLLEKAHTLAEGAGAAPLAAALKIRDRLQGKKVVLILSGGNLSMRHLREALASRPAPSSADRYQG
ncbi:MAG: threonine/serine dehydratase [Dehalococcoidia bacterium]